MASPASTLPVHAPAALKCFRESQAFSRPGLCTSQLTCLDAHPPPPDNPAWVALLCEEIKGWRWEGPTWGLAALRAGLESLQRN